MCCAECQKSLSTQEQVSYGSRCEDCFSDSQPNALDWYTELLGVPSTGGKRRAVKGGHEPVEAQAQYARAVR